MKKLLIGTTNKAKFEEYKNLLKGLPLKLMNLDDVDLKEVPDEQDRGLEDNAVIKAKYYFAHTNIPSLVEENGLEVEALDSGKNNRKWIEKNLSNDDLIEKIMAKMTGKTNRGCRLNLMVALSTPMGVMTSDAVVEGVIAESPSNKKIQGHPYRSLMYFPKYGKYYCDITDEEHEILNHRKHAIEKIKDMFVEISKD